MDKEHKTIIKIQKRENPYLQIDKSCVNNEKLSWKAKGMLAYLLSKPDDWQVYLTDLKNKATDGMRSVSSGIRELEQHHYIEKKKKRNKKGRFEGWEYLVYEQPRCQKGISVRAKTETPKPESGKPENGKQHATNNKDTKKEKTKLFVLKDYLELMKTDPKRHIQIIAVWIEAKGLKPDNKDQVQSIITRNLRPAKLLVGYKDDDIIETVKIIRNTDWIRKFELETVSKFIDETVAQRIKRGPKIIRYEEVKRDGHLTMRPIYETIKQ